MMASKQMKISCKAPQALQPMLSQNYLVPADLFHVTTEPAVLHILLTYNYK